MKHKKLNVCFVLTLLCLVNCLLLPAMATAQFGSTGIYRNNPLLDGGTNRPNIGNGRLHISNGISNGTIGLTPNASAPGLGITPPALSTFGSPGGGPGGGNPPPGGTFNAPLDGGALILIFLGIGLFLHLRLRELHKRRI
ncbi:hypothetical protein [Hydrotalea sp.]|uniref:hypothetical protein n=1 Tax=Hydrotalea sp. TaxID=2881279 RepID=UPI003D12666F